MKTRLLSPHHSQPNKAFKHRDDMKVDTFVRVSKHLHIYVYFVKIDILQKIFCCGA